jgi:hypothetical protein
VFEILDRVVEVAVVFLEKGVDLHASLEPKQLPDLRLGEALGAVAFESESFEGGAGQALAICRELASEIVRDVEGDLHGNRIARIGLGCADGDQWPGARADGEVSAGCAGEYRGALGRRVTLKVEDAA